MGEDDRVEEECLNRGYSAPAQEEHAVLLEEVADDPNSDLVVYVIWKENLKRYLVIFFLNKLSSYKTIWKSNLFVPLYTVLYNNQSLSAGGSLCGWNRSLVEQQVGQRQ